MLSNLTGPMSPSPINKNEIFPFSVYLVTCGSAAEAEIISTALLDNRLIACANIIGGAEKSLYSIYKWEGKVEKDAEMLLVMKSRSELLEEIVSAVKKAHSYDVPEVIALPMMGGSKEYLDWVLKETKEAGSG
jgi:periplasmic divalent cation tolerance protein